MFISYNSYKKIPALQKSLLPVKSTGRTINGTDVPATGEVNLKFLVKGYHIASNLYNDSDESEAHLSDGLGSPKAQSDGGEAS